MSSPTVRSTETTGPGNAATVAGIYAAFGRGDVPAVLPRSPTTSVGEERADNTAQRAGVEHLTPRRGPAEAAGFFELVGRWTLRRFEVLDVIGDGRQVVAEIRGRSIHRTERASTTRAAPVDLRRHRPGDPLPTLRRHGRAHRRQSRRGAGGVTAP
ncbi:nuclear transport factor 2 family protein [Geodermatophilus sp. SYSU D00697]